MLAPRRRAGGAIGYAGARKGDAHDVALAGDARAGVQVEPAAAGRINVERWRATTMPLEPEPEVEGARRSNRVDQAAPLVALLSSLASFLSVFFSVLTVVSLFSVFSAFSALSPPHVETGASVPMEGEAAITGTAAKTLTRTTCNS